MREKLPGGVLLYSGDCLEVLKRFKDNTMDSCVSDPPYHLVSIVKRFGKVGSAPVKVDDINASNDLKAAYARHSKGFMGKVWDGGDIAFRPELWAEVYRVLKPGAHLLAFGGTRTYHNMAWAVEQAGFEVRDCIQWLFGTGFPKSHDVSKGIDRAAGASRKRVSGGVGSKTGVTYSANGGYVAGEAISDEPITDEAELWNGWGSALKPAVEMIVLARKPLSEKTVAANVLKWGTGALNINSCRIGVTSNDSIHAKNPHTKGGFGHGAAAIYGKSAGADVYNPAQGRWPANVITDGSDEVVAAFPVLGKSAGGRIGNAGGGTVQNLPTGKVQKGDPGYGDSGSAARFFYSSKADQDDRLSSSHPTVKPVDLMQYLVRLITPPGGRVLDMFAGTGTTGEAAFKEKMRSVLIEAEPEYQADIRRRMILAAASVTEALEAAATLPADLKKRVETNLKRPNLFSQRGK